jgi:transcriptional repressor NrdR
LQVEKVESGIERALGGRMVSDGVIAGILGEVESAARAAAPAISSEEVGRIVLEGLKEADEVAYLRFASVYKNFQGAQDFEKEMAALDE